MTPATRPVPAVPTPGSWRWPSWPARRPGRTANLLALARVEKDDAGWALAEARRMLTEDSPGSPGSAVD
jgi:hypothetical protein